MSKRSFLRMAALVERTGASRPTLYRWMQDGTFPRPIRPYPSSAMVCWPSDEIDRWIESRAAAVAETQSGGKATIVTAKANTKATTRRKNSTKR